jgi:alanine transaminase
MTGLMIAPPQQGDHSYAAYEDEKMTILHSLQRRARMLVDALNTLEGVSCNQADGGK